MLFVSTIDDLSSVFCSRACCSVAQLITDESIIAVSENCVGLRCLGVSRCSRLTDAALVALGQTCSELQYAYLLNVLISMELCLGSYRDVSVTS